MRTFKAVRRREPGIRPARRGAFAERRRLNLDGSTYHSSPMHRASSSLELKSTIAAAICGLTEQHLGAFDTMNNVSPITRVLLFAISGALISFMFRMLFLGHLPVSRCIIDRTAAKEREIRGWSALVGGYYLHHAALQAFCFLAVVIWGLIALLVRSAPQEALAVLLFGLLLLNAAWYWRAAYMIVMGHWTVSRRQYPRHQVVRRKVVRGFPAPLSGWRAL